MPKIASAKHEVAKAERLVSHYVRTHPTDLPSFFVRCRQSAVLISKTIPMDTANTEGVALDGAQTEQKKNRDKKANIGLCYTPSNIFPPKEKKNCTAFDKQLNGS